MERMQERVSQANDFDRFLHADVKRRANGPPVIVLSFLARRGLKPWTESRRFAGLPRWVTTDKLARALASGIAVWSTAFRETASRLMLLLPGASRIGSVPSKSSFDREMPKLLLVCGAFGMLHAFGMVAVNVSFLGAETANSKMTVADSCSKVLRMREGVVEGSR